MTSAIKPRLALVLFSGQFDRVHYGLMMAAAALAVNRPVTLFFAMTSCRALLADRDDQPGWAALEPDSSSSRLPLAADQALQLQGIAGFADLLDACLALGVQIMVCEAGLRVSGLTLADLRPGLQPEPGGLASFLSDSGGDMLFI